MGWDVVQIGLRHNLPVDDPIATAKEIATRMKQNIQLVAREFYVPDSKKNFIKHCYAIELGTFKVNESDKSLRLTVLNRQINQQKD
ncbi:hypothetical protein [Porphyromonas endodontalis]